MTRRPRAPRVRPSPPDEAAREPRQLGLFDTLDDAPVRPPAVAPLAATSWAARHWPQYVGLKQGPPPVVRSLQLWAESCHHLAPAAREILVALATRADAGGGGYFNLGSLSEELRVSRNKFKRFLDRLLSAGLVMVKPHTPPTGRMFLGYRFRLIDCAEHRVMAEADGFVSHRHPGPALVRDDV